jgi:hypothetical protein
MKKEAETNPAHVHDLQNARVVEYPPEATPVDKHWAAFVRADLDRGGPGETAGRVLISREQLAAAMVDAVRDFRDFATTKQAEVPMEDERPLPANVQRLIDQHEALGSHRALAQSLGAMATARSAEGAEGHAVICRRAARFVRVMAMQVTRFLAQPDLRLCHPTVEGDLQVTACTVNDNGLVQVMCMGSDDMPAPTLPLHELVPAGPIADMSRVVGQIMARTVVQDAIGQLIKTGKMPGLEELTARHGLDFSEGPVGSQMQPGEAVTYTDVDGREYKGTVQAQPEVDQLHVHNLTAHAGYVLKDGAHTEPEDKP